MARQIETGAVNASELTSLLIESHFSTAGQPAPDLLIRTSGEKRISNFLFWQRAIVNSILPILSGLISMGPGWIRLSLILVVGSVVLGVPRNKYRRLNEVLVFTSLSMMKRRMRISVKGKIYS